METSCSLCGRARLSRDRPEAESQTKQIAQRLGELKVLKTGNASLRSQLEGDTSEYSQQLSIQKAKYIALLQRKELLQQRVHKCKHIFLVLVSYDLAASTSPNTVHTPFMSLM